MKFKMKPIREWGWTDEGICYRKANVVIMKPKENYYRWLIRVVHEDVTIPKKKNFSGETEAYGRKEAFKAGNKCVKLNKDLIC